MRTPLLLLACSLLIGCPPPSAKPQAVPLSAKERSQVAVACGRCHPAPDPSLLPKARWEELIPTMLSMPLPKGVEALSELEVKLALRHYTSQAPDELPRAPQASALSAKLEFTRESFLPQRAEFLSTRAPAVSNLRFVNLSDPERMDLLICEMRSQSLFLLPAWAPSKQRRILGLARGLNYPSRVSLHELTGDGRPDLLVTALGGMNPTNEERGGVLLLAQTPKRKFEARALAPAVGRATDARPADLDGDGDLDLVVCAFGWRGPGKLFVLRNEGGTPTRYEPVEVDARDGYIHAIPHDLDGDGDLDVVAVIAQHHERVVWLRNDGEGRLEPLTLYAAPHPAWGSSGLELHDMDGDGDLDLLLSNGDSLDDRLLKPYHGVGYLELLGLERGLPQVAYRRVGDLYGCEAASAADLDGDGDLDVVGVSFVPQLDPQTWEGLDTVVWFERAPSGWVRHSLEQGRAIHPCLAIGDYDRDGKPDIAVGNYVWIGEGGQATTQADFVTLFTAR